MTNDFYNPSDEQLQDLVDEGTIPSLSEESYSEYEDGDNGYDEYEDDGQPDEYTEWQDYMGGDDWDQGQYDMGGEW